MMAVRIALSRPFGRADQGLAGLADLKKSNEGRPVLDSTLVLKQLPIATAQGGFISRDKPLSGCTRSLQVTPRQNTTMSRGVKSGMHVVVTTKNYP
jgi:hypothetical protein